LKKLVELEVGVPKKVGSLPSAILDGLKIMMEMKWVFSALGWLAQQECLGFFDCQMV
jgi:hypothetical protein